MKSFWDERYSAKEYIYGEEPNVFFAAELRKLKPGTIILPCDGEGRNGVYAASAGWTVKAFDGSEEGKAKALQLAALKKVEIEYVTGDAATITYPEKSADAVAFIYAHLPPDVRKTAHQNAIKWLKPGGVLILEVFNPAQLNNTSGGPKDVAMLYTKEMLQKDFELLETVLLQTLVTTIDEGDRHQGKADIIRYIGIKK
ncbi:class I SAM-dependent methyltransferase [Mucilaginibacter gotjawali]|uniref:SAM-dependent methyltransferase n=1 Tax=Mucilaginibacter gotjawali TaxID=1550579 RepID=A0A839SI95_9SPHI|nr:class I SAM-dependent methyltransferase [Mucilaginibacter gotjawali]MBB3058031.1 SAM-dependent methyltransferase [Mucilaginibacter gotjawali]